MVVDCLAGKVRVEPIISIPGRYIRKRGWKFELVNYRTGGGK